MDHNFEVYTAKEEIQDPDDAIQEVSTWLWLIVISDYPIF